MSTNILNTPLQDITANSIPAKRSPSPLSGVGTPTAGTVAGIPTPAGAIAETIVNPLVGTPASPTIAAIGSPGTAGVTGLSPETPVNPPKVDDAMSQMN